MKKTILFIAILISFLFIKSPAYAQCGMVSQNITCGTNCPPATSTSPIPPDFKFCTSANTASTPTGTPLGPISGLGPLGTIINFLSPNDVTPASNKLALVLSATIGIITICAGFWFMLQILTAGFTWITAGGSKDKLQESQNKITNSVIGLVIVVAAYALTSLFGKILGIPNILDIGAAITNIGQSIKP